MENLHTSIGFFGSNTLHKSQSVDCLSFCLEKSTNKDYKSFKSDLYELHGTNGRLFARLTERRDITQVRIHYLKGKYEDYFVPWCDIDEHHEYDSRYQYAKLLEDGSLTVIISKNPDDIVFE